MLPNSIARDNGQVIVIDRDYAEAEMRDTGAFTSTGLPDELSPGAGMLAAAIDDLMADHAEICQQLAEQPLTIDDAIAILKENAPGYFFGLHERNSGYVGWRPNPANYFSQMHYDCEIQVLADANGVPAKGQPQKFNATNWRTVVNACLAALFPQPKAA